MFNSTILDVAIGMIFVYLLLSLMSSVANELVELFLKKRARQLERGIYELLTDDKSRATIFNRIFKPIEEFFDRVVKRRAAKDDDSNVNSEANSNSKQGIVARIYNHPLINGLFKGEYLKGSRSLPAYIPATNFALALMDLIPKLSQSTAAGATTTPATPPTPGASAMTSGAANAMASPPVAPTTPFSVVLNVTPTSESTTQQLPPLPTPPAASTPVNQLANLRNAVASLADEKIKNALLPLIDAAGNDASQARLNIENWYNSAMDRVSGWYKRRAQVFLFVIGFAIAVALNVDSITVGKRLSTDKSLRDSLVAAADAYAKANATSSPSPTPKTSAETNKPAEQSGQKPAGAPSSRTSPTPATSPTPPPDKKGTPSPTPSPTPCWAEACKPGKENSAECRQKKNQCEIESCWHDACQDGADSPQCKLKKNQCELESLNLPIGWSTSNDVRLQWPGWHWRQYGGWWWQLYWHWLGWLLTALAISLGAPFWFDMLNKFMVVRATVKPKEKSSEEGSKD